MLTNSAAIEKCDAFFNQWQTPKICKKEPKKEKCLCCLEVPEDCTESIFKIFVARFSGKRIYLYFSLCAFVIILWGFHREEIYTNFALYSFFKKICCVILYKKHGLLSLKNSDSITRSVDRARDRKQEGSRFHLPWLTAVVKELYICWSTCCVKYQTQWNLISLSTKDKDRWTIVSQQESHSSRGAAADYEIWPSFIGPLFQVFLVNH